MAKLPNKRREFLNRIAKELLILLGSSTLVAGLFMTAITMFSIPYGINTWNKGGVSDGAANVWNTIADTLGKSNYILIRKYDTAGGDCGTFLTLVLIGLMIVCYLIFKSRNLLLVLVPAVPLLVFSIGFGIYPSAVSVTILVTGVATQVIHGNMGERFGLTGVIMVVCSVAFILPFAVTGTGLSLIEKPYALKKIADSAYEKTGLLRYGRDTLGNGDMITDKRSGKTKALSVKMEKPHPMYLRGFVGENFDGRRWLPLDKELHYESLPVFKGLGKANFNARGQLADAARIAGMKENGGKVEIETIGASRLYAYTPYEITGKKPAGTKDWSGAFLTGDGLRGVNSYSYTAGEDLTSVWTDVAGKLYSSEESESIKKYSAAESHYNVFAYKNYTFLTDAQVETLADEIGTRGNQEKGHIAYKTAISKVKSYFDNNVIYADLDKSKTDSLSPVEKFFKSHKGRDVDYAAAAVLMFRYYGIPARYVEGYLITTDAAKKMQPGKKRTIRSDEQHAWPEIYIDGVGWVPVEVCAEYYNKMPQADMNRGLSSASSSNPFNQSERVTSRKPVKEPKRQTEKNIPWKEILIIVGIVILSILIVFGVIGSALILRKVYRRRKLFAQRNVSKAICAMMDYARIKELVLSVHVISIGNEAAYSSHVLDEDKRSRVLDDIKRAKEEKRSRKNPIKGENQSLRGLKHEKQETSKI